MSFLHPPVRPKAWSNDVAVVVGPARYTTIKIAPNIQHMLWFAGLRGAMAYACSKQVRGTRSSYTGCGKEGGREGGGDR